tara:strand:- start:123836 stop:124579 length:744 start_codon:yes stop_codon:yes gene_type:complete
MSVNSREKLKEYCLRQLGKPVININVAEEQIQDRIDDALQKYTEEHYDGSVEEWVSYKITQEDIDNGYMSLPDNILVVTDIMPINEIVAHNSLFSYQYQVAMQELSNFTPFDSSDYFMKMFNYNSVSDMLSGASSYNFVRHQNRIYINSASSLGELGVDYPLGFKVIRLLDPQNAPSMFNEVWLKKYTTALIKKQWGNNMKKMSGVQLLGGVELNGQQIYDEAVEEIEQLEVELEEKYSEPLSFIVG